MADRRRRSPEGSQHGTPRQDPRYSSSRYNENPQYSAYQQPQQQYPPPPTQYSNPYPIPPSQPGQYGGPPPIQMMPQPGGRTHSPVAYSSSSSSSSSYLDISRSYPPKRSGLRAFFTTPSEHRRIRRRRSRKLFKFNNSSSSSVNSDLAYGTGFIKRKHLKRSNSGKGKDRGRDTEGERERHREEVRTNVYTENRASGGAGGSAGGSKVGKTEAEILAIGAGLAKIARDQNKRDLRNASRNDLSGGGNQYSASRGLAPSKVSHKPDEDGWESASDDDSDSSVDSKLAFSNESTVGFWSWGKKQPQKPVSRKSTLVDPQLFGPENSLHGIITEPVGFNGDVRWNSTTNFGPQNFIPNEYGGPPSYPGSINVSQTSLQQVFPVSTSDPHRVDAARTGGSIVSGPEIYTPSSRPDPVPIQHPKPFTPVSQSVFEPSYATRSETEIRRKDSSNRGSSVAGAALAGLAGAAVVAAVTKKDDRDEKRGDETRRAEERARRREDERREEERSRRREEERREEERLRRKEEERRHEDLIRRRDEERREVDRLKRLEDERKEADRSKKRDKDSRKDSPDRKSKDKEKRKSSSRGSVIIEDDRKDKKSDKKRDETREDKDKRREKRREDRQSDRGDDYYESRRTKSETSVPQTAVDPFQYQVRENSFDPNETAVSAPAHGRVGSVPTVVTVEREPDFSRKRSSSIKDVPPYASDSGRYTEYDDRGRDYADRDRPLERGEKAYHEIQDSTAPLATAAIAAGVVAVAAEGYRESRSEKRRKERSGESNEYDDRNYSSYDRDREPERGREPREKERDPVQEEADRAYRELVMARKIASQVIRSRTPSPDRSVIHKYDHKEEEEIIRIQTPPEMKEHPKGKGPYDAPNADFKPDYILRDPKELQSFSVVPFSNDRSAPESAFLKRDPDADRPRPHLNLVHPTPTPTPQPERQAAKSQANEPPQSTDPGSKAQPASNDVVVGPRGVAVVASPTASNVSKVVSWGQNQTKHYEVESPQEHREEFVTKDEVQSRDREQPRPTVNTGRGGWGIVAASVGATAGVISAARSSERSQSPTTRENERKDSIPYEYRGVIVEPEPSSPIHRQPSPPSPGPKPSIRSPPTSFSEKVQQPIQKSIAASNDQSLSKQSTEYRSEAPASQGSRVPGAFDDDLDFTAHVAAALQDTGFDPNIVINDPSFRRRDSPPGSNEPIQANIYHAPFAETVTDLGAGSSANRGGQGFVIGEGDQTPTEWRTGSPDGDDTFSKVSRKEQKKRDKEAKRQSVDASTFDEAPTREFVEEPDSYFGAAKLSKKEQRKRDKEAQRERAYADDQTPLVDTIAVAPEVFETTEGYFETPKKSKKKSKKGSGYDDEPETPQSVTVPVDAFADLQKADDLWDDQKKSKKKSKKSSGFNDESDTPQGVIVPVNAFDDLQRADEEWDEPKKSKKKPKHDSDRYDSPARSGPSSEVGTELERSSSKKSKDKSRRTSEIYQPNPSEISLPPSTPSETSQAGDYYESRSSRKSNRDSGIFDSADRDDSRSVVSTARTEDGEPRRKKKSRSSTKDDFDDTRSVASAPAGDDEDRKNKKKEKKSGSGFFGLFGSKSDVGVSDDSPKRSKDDTEESRKKNKKEKRRSVPDSSGLYGDLGSGSVNDLSRSVSNGHSNGSYQYDDDDPGARSDGERRKTRSRAESTSSKKDSFLDNAGTLGAGVGLVGVAAALAAQQHQQSKASHSEKRAITKSASPERTVKPLSLQEEILDPEIVARQIRPSIDPQYGDLLPLPPSNPGTPHSEVLDEFPELPDSRPGTPEMERISRPSASVLRKSFNDVPNKSPSQSAIPLTFRLGNRSIPSSPAAIRSPTTPAFEPSGQESMSLPRTRPSRPTSWEHTKEYKPLYLVETTRRLTNAQAEEPELVLPELPPSQGTSRSSSQHELDDRKNMDVAYVPLSSDGPSSGPLSIDVDLASRHVPADILGSQQSTPKAGIPSDFGDFDLPASKSREFSEPVDHWDESASVPGTKDKSILSKDTAIKAATGVGAASVLGYVASAHTQRTQKDDWMDDLPSTQRRPSPVDPMSKDRSSYLLNSSPASRIYDDSETVSLDTGSPLSRKLRDDSRLREIGEVAIEDAPEHSPTLPSLPSQPEGRSINVFDFEDTASGEPSAFILKKDKKKDRKKGKSLSRTSTQDDLLSESEAPPTILPTMETPTNIEPIGFDLPKSKKDKKKDKKKVRAVSIWNDELIVDTPVEAVRRTFSEEPQPVVEKALSLVEVETVDEFALPSSKKDKKQKKKKGKATSSWDDEVVEDADRETIAPPTVKSEDTLENTAASTRELPQESDEPKQVTVEADTLDAFSLPKSKKEKKKDKKKSKTAIVWDDAAETPVSEQPIADNTRDAMEGSKALSATLDSSADPLQKEIERDITTLSVSKDISADKNDREIKLSNQDPDQKLDIVEETSTGVEDFTPTKSKKDKKKDKKRKSALLAWDKPSEEPIDDTLTHDTPDLHQLTAIKDPMLDDRSRTPTLPVIRALENESIPTQNLDVGHGTVDLTGDELTADEFHDAQDGMITPSEAEVEPDVFSTPEARKEKEPRSFNWGTSTDQAAAPMQPIFQPTFEPQVTTNVPISGEKLEPASFSQTEKSDAADLNSASEVQDKEEISEAVKPELSFLANVDDVPTTPLAKLVEVPRPTRDLTDSNLQEPYVEETHIDDSIVSKGLYAPLPTADTNEKTQFPPVQEPTRLARIEAIDTSTASPQQSTDRNAPVAEDTIDAAMGPEQGFEFAIKKSKKDKKKAKEAGLADEVPRLASPVQKPEEPVFDTERAPEISTAHDEATSEDLFSLKKSKKDKKGKKARSSAPWDVQEEQVQSVDEPVPQLDVEPDVPSSSAAVFDTAPVPVETDIPEEFAVSKKKKGKKGSKSRNSVSWDDPIESSQPHTSDELNRGLDEAPIEVPILPDEAINETPNTPEEEALTDDFALPKSKKDKKKSKKSRNSVSWEDEEDSAAPPTPDVDLSAVEAMPTLNPFGVDAGDEFAEPKSKKSKKKDKKSRSEVTFEDPDVVSETREISVISDLQEPLSNIDSTIPIEAEPADEFALPKSKKDKKSKKAKASLPVEEVPFDGVTSEQENSALPTSLGDNAAIRTADDTFSAPLDIDPMEEFSLPKSKKDKKKDKKKAKATSSWESEEAPKTPDLDVEPPVIAPSKELPGESFDTATIAPNAEEKGLVEKVVNTQNLLVEEDDFKGRELAIGDSSEPAIEPQAPATLDIDNDVSIAKAKKDKKKDKKKARAAIWDDETPVEKAESSEQNLESQDREIAEASPEPAPTEQQGGKATLEDEFSAPKSKKDKKKDKKKPKFLAWEDEPEQVASSPKDTKDNLVLKEREAEVSLEQQSASLEAEDEFSAPKSKKDKKKDRKKLKAINFDDEPMSDLGSRAIDLPAEKDPRELDTFVETSLPKDLPPLETSDEPSNEALGSKDTAQASIEPDQGQLRPEGEQRDGFEAGYNNDQLSLARQLQLEFAAGNKKSKKDKKKRQSLPSTPELEDTRSRAIDDETPDHPRARSLSIGPTATRSADSPASDLRRSLYSEDQLELAKQLKAEFGGSSKKSKKDKKKKGGDPGPANFEDENFPSQPSEDVSDFVTPLEQPAGVTQEFTPRDGFEAGYQEDQLSLARQLQAEFGNKKSKKDKKKRSDLSRSTTQDDLGPPTEEASEFVTPMEEPQPTGDEDVSKRDGFEAGYQEDQLSLARQLQAEFAKKSKKDKKDKKRRSTPQTPLEKEPQTDYFGDVSKSLSAEPLPADVEGPDAESPAIDSTPRDRLASGYNEDQLDLARQLKEEFGAGSKKSKKDKKGKKRESLLQSNTEGDFASDGFDVARTPDTDSPATFQDTTPIAEEELAPLSKKSKKDKKAKNRGQPDFAWTDAPEPTPADASRSIDEAAISETPGTPQETLVTDPVDEWSLSGKKSKDKKGMPGTITSAQDDIQPPINDADDLEFVSQKTKKDKKKKRGSLPVTTPQDEGPGDTPRAVEIVPEATTSQPMDLDSPSDVATPATDDDSSGYFKTKISKKDKKKRQSTTVEDLILDKPKPETDTVKEILTNEPTADVNVAKSDAEVTDSYDFVPKKSKKEKRKSLLRNMSTVDDETESIPSQEPPSSEPVEASSDIPLDNSVSEQLDEFEFSTKKSKKDKKQRKISQQEPIVVEQPDAKPESTEPMVLEHGDATTAVPDSSRSLQEPSLEDSVEHPVLDTVPETPQDEPEVTFDDYTFTSKKSKKDKKKAKASKDNSGISTPIDPKSPYEDSSRDLKPFGEDKFGDAKEDLTTADNVLIPTPADVQDDDWTSRFSTKKSKKDKRKKNSGISTPSNEVTTTLEAERGPAESSSHVHPDDIPQAREEPAIDVTLDPENTEVKSGFATPPEEVSHAGPVGTAEDHTLLATVDDTPEHVEDDWSSFPVKKSKKDKKKSKKSGFSTPVDEPNELTNDSVLAAEVPTEPEVGDEWSSPVSVKKSKKDKKKSKSGLSTPREEIVESIENVNIPSKDDPSIDLDRSVQPISGEAEAEHSLRPVTPALESSKQAYVLEDQSAVEVPLQEQSELKVSLPGSQDVNIKDSSFADLGHLPTPEPDSTESVSHIALVDPIPINQPEENLEFGAQDIAIEPTQEQDEWELPGKSSKKSKKKQKSGLSTPTAEHASISDTFGDAPVDAVAPATPTTVTETPQQEEWDFPTKSSKKDKKNKRKSGLSTPIEAVAALSTVHDEAQPRDLENSLESAVPKEEATNVAEDDAQAFAKLSKKDKKKRKYGLSTPVDDMTSSFGTERPTETVEPISKDIDLSGQSFQQADEPVDEWEVSRKLSKKDKKKKKSDLSTPVDEIALLETALPSFDESQASTSKEIEAPTSPIGESLAVAESEWSVPSTKQSKKDKKKQRKSTSALVEEPASEAPVQAEHIPPLSSQESATVSDPVIKTTPDEAAKLDGSISPKILERNLDHGPAPVEVEQPVRPIPISQDSADSFMKQPNPTDFQSLVQGETSVDPLVTTGGSADASNSFMTAANPSDYQTLPLASPEQAVRPTGPADTSNAFMATPNPLEYQNLPQDPPKLEPVVTPPGVADASDNFMMSPNPLDYETSALRSSAEAGAIEPDEWAVSSKKSKKDKKGKRSSRTETDVGFTAPAQPTTGTTSPPATPKEQFGAEEATATVSRKSSKKDKRKRQIPLDLSFAEDAGTKKLTSWADEVEEAEVEREVPVIDDIDKDESLAHVASTTEAAPFDDFVRPTKKGKKGKKNQSVDLGSSTDKVSTEGSSTGEQFKDKPSSLLPALATGLAAGAFAAAVGSSTDDAEKNGSRKIERTPSKKASKKDKRKKEIDQRTPREDIFDDPQLWGGKDPKVHEETRGVGGIEDDDAGSDGFWSPPDQEEVDVEPTRKTAELGHRKEIAAEEVVPGSTTERSISLGPVLDNNLSSDDTRLSIEVDIPDRPGHDHKIEITAPLIEKDYQSQERSLENEKMDSRSVVMESSSHTPQRYTMPSGKLEHPSKDTFPSTPEVTRDAFFTPTRVERIITEEAAQERSPFRPQSRNSKFALSGFSDLPAVVEEFVEDEPRHKSLQDVDMSPNRDSAFVSGSPTPGHRSLASVHEPIRDSGVHLRDESPSDRKLREVSSSDAALARLSWPSVDEEHETVDIHKSQRQPSAVHHQRGADTTRQIATTTRDLASDRAVKSPGPVDLFPAARAAKSLVETPRSKADIERHKDRHPLQRARDAGPPDLFPSPKHDTRSPDPIKHHSPEVTHRDLLPSQKLKEEQSSPSLHRSKVIQGKDGRRPSEGNLIKQRLQLFEGEAPREEQPKTEKYGELGSQRPRAEQSRGFSDTGLAGAAIAAGTIGFAAARQSSAEKRPDSAQSQRSISNINRLRTPDPKLIRPESALSNRSGTPPLRRTDRKLSGDLRSLSQRSKPDLAKEAELAAAAVATVNTANPTANEGRVRAKDMADVYDGFGEGRMGSPRSPTRPHSMRRRQSMQVLELESKLEQLAAENRSLTDANAQAERSLQQSRHASSSVIEKDAEIDALKRTLEWMQKEVTRLTEVNEGLQSANATLGTQQSQQYGNLEREHNETTRELQELRNSHNTLMTGMAGMVAGSIVLDKDREIAKLRAELDTAKEKIREMQRQILATKANEGSEFLVLRDEDYFDTACQQLCQHVQQWVLRFSKFSDMRACRLTSEINNDKTIDRLDNAILDGSDVDTYLSDRIKRRDVFMSMTMTMIWEFIFTRYLFGMDREQRQKLKTLEKLLQEVGPAAAVHQWRATTLTLLSKRNAFAQQRDQDTQAVVNAILETLSEILPPPSHLEGQIEEQLLRVIKSAVDLSIEMRTQRAEYMMLPPLQPEYDANGDLASKVSFNAALMNERSGDTLSNEDLEEQKAVVRIVLFPLVVKKGDDKGEGDDEIVVCPAQVLVAGEKKGKKVRVLGPGSVAGGNASRLSMQSGMPMDEGSAI